MPAIEPRLLEPRTDTTGPVTAEARLALTFSGRQSAKAAKVTVAFSEDTSAQQVTMNVDARGLAPNTEYGLHIHVYGDSSSDDALAMAGHFNPDASPHGCPILPENSRSPAEARPGTHYGDFGNLLTDSTGSSSQTFTSHFLSLRNASAPGYVPGRGVILHRQRDDCETQPTGNAGARLAQGVIALKDGKGEGTWKGVEGDAVDAIGVFDAHVAGSVVATRSSATGLDLLLNLTGLAFGETYKLSVGTFEYDTNNKFPTQQDCESSIATFTASTKGTIECKLRVSTAPLLGTLFGQSFLLLNASPKCGHIPILAAIPIGVKDGKTTQREGWGTCSVKGNVGAGLDSSEFGMLALVLFSVVLFLGWSCVRRGSGYRKVPGAPAEPSASGKAD